MKRKKSGFTLFEVIFMVIVVSVGIIWIVRVLNNGFAFLQKTRERTIAINLAREGMEAVYQIRDTNRWRRAGKKEESWLKTDPLQSGSTWISTWYYILTTATTGGQEYFALTGKYQTWINLADWITGDLAFSMCEQSDNTRKACPWSQPSSKEGKFLRQIHGIGLFAKDTNITGGLELSCANGTPSTCNDTSAKEFRFCSEVHYIGQWKWSVELCWMITNFQKK